MQKAKKCPASKPFSAPCWSGEREAAGESAKSACTFSKNMQCFSQRHATLFPEPCSSFPEKRYGFFRRAARFYARRVAPWAEGGRHFRNIPQQPFCLKRFIIKSIQRYGSFKAQKTGNTFDNVLKC